jgi:hypothetical protein
MELLFPADKSIELLFKVGIAGTNSLPSSVAVILDRAGTALSFKAEAVGEEWRAVIDKPGLMFSVGKVDLSINVIVNSRLFTPMKAVAEISAAEEQDAAPDEIQHTTPPEAHAPEVKPAPVQLNTGMNPPIKQKVEAVVTPSAPPVRMQLLKSIQRGTVKESKTIDKAPEVIITKKPQAKPATLHLKKIRVVYK